MKLPEDFFFQLKNIIDPDDNNKYNPESILKAVERLIRINKKSHDLINLIYENDALKTPNYIETDEVFSIHEFLEKTYMELKGYKAIYKE